MLSLEMTREEKNLRQHFQAKMEMRKRKRVKKERRKSDES